VYYLLYWPIVVAGRIGMPTGTVFASNASEGSALLFYLGVSFA